MMRFSRPLRRALAPVPCALLALLVVASGCSRSPEERLQSAIDKLENEQPPDLWGAITILRALARDAAVDADLRTEAFIRLSGIHVSMQEFDEALALMDDAAALHGGGSTEGQTIFRLRLQLLAMAGKNEEAAGAIRKYLSDHADLPVPNRTRLRIDLGAFLARSGAKDEARETFEALITEYDDPLVHAAVLDPLVMTYLPDEPLSAAERYLAYASAHPGRDLAMMARYGAGVLLRQVGEEARAEPELEAYFAWAEREVEEALEPAERFEALVKLARGYEQLGRTEDFVRVLERGRELYADEAGPYASLSWQLVDPLVDLGRRDEAFGALRSIIERFPESEEAKRVPQLLAMLEAGLRAFDERQAQEAAALAEIEENADGEDSADGDVAAGAAAAAEVTASGTEAAEGDAAGEE